MSDQKPQDAQPKKVNRFAKLKNKTENIGFVPAKEQQPEQKKEPEVVTKPQPVQEVDEESQKVMNDLKRMYDDIITKMSMLRTELQPYMNRSQEEMTSEQRYDYMVTTFKMMALTEKFNVNDFKDNYYQYIREEDLRDIASNLKHYQKYHLMRNHGKEWKTPYNFFVETLENILGISTVEKQVYNELDILKDVKKVTKTKKGPKVPMPVNIEPVFKPIVFKPEEVVDREDLVLQAKQTGLKVPDQTKEPLILIFIGHVDSGKSTTSGNILYLSGKVDELELKKLKAEAEEKDRESWYVAYLMDINEEEREKGKTVEVGRATFETHNKRFTVLDCPGHRNYVQNMISGAAQADVACLIVSAKPGEFEAGFEKDGQTREHAMLAKSLGAKNLVVCVNKMDTVKWDQERFAHIKKNLTPFLTSSCDYQEDKIKWVCIEGLTGKNIKEPLSKEIAPWYNLTTLFDTLDSLPRIKRSDKKIVRFPILDKIYLQGSLYIFGKVESGIIRQNMKVTIMPHQKEITVLKIFDDNDDELAFADVGESAKLAVKGIEEGDVRRGDVICGLQYWVNVCNEFEAEVKVLDLMPTHFFGPGFTVMMHMHTILEEVNITKIIKRLDDGDKETEDETKKASKFLRSQEKGILRFKTKNPVCLEKYDDFVELGRFALRKDAFTVGIGKVTKFKPINKELLKENYYFKTGEKKE